MKNFVSITTIVLMFIQIVIITYFIVKINNNFREHQNTIENKLSTNIDKLYRNNYLFENDTIKRYKLTKKDLNEIKSHINYLSQEVDKASKNTQDILENDIDRLNTFMAMGLGFLALFGIFAPLTMNLLFKSDIENDLVDYKKQSKSAITDSKAAKKITDEIQPIIEPTKKIILEFPPLQEGFQRLDNELKERSPQVALLILQNQISRLYNISKIDAAVRKNRHEYFSIVFQNILFSLKEIKKSIFEPTV